ncbi:hypothetical protein V6N11_078328 [Hibiscus sabdariffa]|uniref:Uncharacterized protein n=1 Tax=Hibiscus sabdariffa TaxID=183260 RepID=A0ABR2TGH7_9ROSI
MSDLFSMILNSSFVSLDPAARFHDLRFDISFLTARSGRFAGGLHLFEDIFLLNDGEGFDLRGVRTGFARVLPSALVSRLTLYSLTLYAFPLFTLFVYAAPYWIDALSPSSTTWN